MIKANELRIGNWVSNGEKQFTADANVIYDAANFEHYVLEPIPLTAEILEKCGFVKDEDGCLKKGYMYWIQKNKEEGFIQIALGYAPLSNLYHIKHVHQLQNVIFWLMNEEPNINLQ
jgi:hypothetical protein